jgi:hypothetical protein
MQPIRRKDWEWATAAPSVAKNNILSSIYIEPADEEVANLRLLKRWMEDQKNEVRYKEYHLEDADFVVIAFGTAGRWRSPPCGLLGRRHQGRAVPADHLSTRSRTMSG